MENTFQLVQVSFKDPHTGKEFNGFCIGQSFMSSAEFKQLFESDENVSAVLMPPKLSPPMKLEDAAAFEEMKELMESLSLAIEKLER
jgi:hypothetical protein